jgi:sugar phosphate isomerase/epimerase
VGNPIAFHTGALGAYSAGDAIARIAAAGYDGVELNAEDLPWAKPHVTPATPSAERSAIRKAAGEVGLRITSLSAHIPLVAADLGERRAAIDFSTGCVDLALDLGTNVIHGLTGVVPEGVTLDQAWAWTVEAIDEIASYAASHGVKYGIEPVVGMLVANGAGYGRLLAALPGCPLGMNFDPSHLQVEGEDPADVARRFGDRIVAAHVKDAKGSPESFQFPPFGLGAVDFAALAQAFQAIGYHGPLVVEYEAEAHGGYLLPEDEILKGSLAFVKKYFG